MTGRRLRYSASLCFILAHTTGAWGTEPQRRDGEIAKAIRFTLSERVDAAKGFQSVVADEHGEYVIHVIDRKESTLYVMTRLPRLSQQTGDDQESVSVRKAESAYTVDKETGKITFLTPQLGTVEFGEGDEWRWLPSGDQVAAADAAASVDCDRVNDQTWCCAITSSVRIICICWTGSKWVVCLDITLQ